MLENDLTSAFRHQANIPGLVVGIAGRSGPAGEHFNLSFATETFPGEVVTNRSSFCSGLGIDIGEIVVPRQVHGSRVATVTCADRGRGARTWESAIPATDAMITRDRDLFMFQIYADCTPLLFADPRNGIFGIAHAGWRGTADSIAGATVRQMTEQFETNPEDIIALIGPAIGACCYEVSGEVATAIRDAAESDSVVAMGPRGRPHVDLAEANRLQLLSAGLGDRNILMSRVCTGCHVASYFSHRAEAGRAGRFAAVIGIRGNASNIATSF